MAFIGNSPAQGIVTSGVIQDGTVNTVDLADYSVTTEKVANGAITADKIALGAAVPTQSGHTGEFLTTDGTTSSWAPPFDQSLNTNDSPSFTAVTTSTYNIGNNWTVVEDGSGNLLFSNNGTNKMKLDASGNLQVTGNIESNATI